MNASYVLLYIDPGTGGMLFTILFGVIGAAFYFLRTLLLKVKFLVTGGKKAKISANKIPIAIFSDHKRYWNIFEPICDELEKRKQNAVFLTASEDDPALSKEYEYIKCEYLGKGNRAFSKLNMLNACVVLSTTPSLDVFQWKRSRDVDYYIHIPHGSNGVAMYRMYGIDYYDAILLSGQYQIEEVRKLEKLRNLPAKEMELVGIPYMDELMKKLEAAPALPEHKRTVLVAPTWGESGILNRYGERIIDALIKTGYRIVVRPHPQSFTSEKDMMDRLMKKYDDPEVVEWNRDNDNFEILRQSDILISDFSGVIFDFAFVFNKPIIYADTSFDSAPLDCAWIEEEMWTFSVLPRLGKQLKEENLDGIKELIDSCLDTPSVQKEREAARAETWVHMGEGTVRTVDYIINKYQSISSAMEEGEAQKCPS